MKRIYLIIAVAATVAVAMLGLLSGYSYLTTDPELCRALAAELNRWEFCNTELLPFMMMGVLAANDPGPFTDNVGLYSNRYGVECQHSENCDFLTYARVVMPSDPVVISRNSDIIFMTEGKYHPTNMTIKIQEFTPVPVMTPASEDVIMGVENITDTALTLNEKEAFNRSQESSSFRYATDNLPNGYFILNVIAKWDVHTLQDQERVILYRFKTMVTD